MKARASILATLGLLASLALAASSQAATPAPAWAIQSLASPTNFKPGDESGLDRYQVSVTNSGGEQTDGATPIEIVDTLPAGLAVSKVELRGPRGNVTLPACSTEEAGASATVSCEVSEALLPAVEPALLYPGNQLVLEIQVKTPPTASGPLVSRIEVEGGAAPTASYEASNRASTADAGAGFQEFRAELLNAFNNVNFTPVAQTGTSLTQNQITAGYRDVNGTQDPGGRLVQFVFRVTF